jgi:peptidyl-prolyl cis-trans isomerase SurA
MIPMRKIFIPLLLLLVALPLSADTVVEEIVARVNNSIITLTEYQRSAEQIKQEAQQQDPANAEQDYDQRKRDILRDLIDQQLLLEKGKDLGITADTELIKRLDEMRKQMNLDSMEALEKAAEAQGVSFEDFKQNLRNQIITQDVIQKEVSPKLTISKEEELKFYNAHKDEMAQPEQIRLSEILIAPQKTELNVSDEQQLAAAKAKADDLLAQIRKGASFQDLAKKFSNGPTAAQGGDLGYFKRGALAKQLEDLTFAMKAGDVSNVIQTKQGYVILKVSEHDQAGIPPLKDIEPRVQDAIYMKKLQPALRDYLTKLREDADIYVRTGYVDSGASPNQTHPIETTQKETGAKRLKKKKKFGVF